MDLVVVIVIGIRVLVVFLGDGHRSFYAGYGCRQLITRNDSTLGKLPALEILTRRTQYGERMSVEHQDFRRRLRMKNDKHVRNSHNGHIPTLPEAATTAKTVNGSHCL